MGKPKNPTVHERWARLRFSVIGQLPAAPPKRGELQRELEAARCPHLAASGERQAGPLRTLDHRALVCASAPGGARSGRRAARPVSRVVSRRRLRQPRFWKYRRMLEYDGMGLTAGLRSLRARKLS